jgi:hypothetical protein
MVALRSPRCHRVRAIAGFNLEEQDMGLAWQQGPLAPGAVGRFLVPAPLPERLLCAEPLRRRMRVRFGGTWVPHGIDRDLSLDEAPPGGRL